MPVVTDFLQTERPRRCIMVTAYWQLGEIQEAADRLHMRLMGKELVDQIVVNQ